MASLNCLWSSPRGGGLSALRWKAQPAQIRNAFEGNIARRFAEGDEEVAVRVRQVFDQDGTAALRQLSLRTPSGEFAPLTEIVDLTDAQGFSVILRRDGKALVSVVADVDSTVTLEQRDHCRAQAIGFCQIWHSVTA